MAELMEKASSWLSLLPRITMINLLEVAIISILVYEILFWVKNTRAWCSRPPWVWGNQLITARTSIISSSTEIRLTATERKI